MSAATRAEAHTKLAKINVKIAYPDKWRDYSGLEIRRDDLLGNVMRANQFEWNWQAARAGQPKDPTEWFMTPQTVNAYYLPTNNEIVFPAAFLQPPFFNMQADDAVNYGAIGCGDRPRDQPRLRRRAASTTATATCATGGRPRTTRNSSEARRGLVQPVLRLRGAAGPNVNGELTLGENIGDLSGAAVAYARL